jgi:hypothetical protein
VRAVHHPQISLDPLPSLLPLQTHHQVWLRPWYLVFIIAKSREGSEPPKLDGQVCDLVLLHRQMLELVEPPYRAGQTCELVVVEPQADKGSALPNLIRQLDELVVVELDDLLRVGGVKVI